jgi:HEAT repeat protein
MRAADDTSRAWTIIDQGAANADKITRLKAVAALGLLVKDERARRLADSKIKDPESTVRAAAATALGQIELTTSSAALKQALRDADAEVVFAAASALLRLNDADACRICIEAPRRRPIA